MAGLSVMIFLTSRLILSSLWSLLITAAATFGTPVWSTASRAVWSHTWGIFILGFVLWFLVRAEVRQARLRPVLLATCLSWLYFVRPTFSVAIVGITLYVFIYHRQVFLPFVITGCVWLAAFVGFSEYHFGELLPLYYRCQWDGFRFATSFPEGLAGSLISPARGLFVYVPIVIFVAYLLVRYRKTLRLRLAVLAASVICLHLLLISAYGPWHAGHSYGPRYSTDLVPWFALLGMLAVEARLRWRAANRLADSVVRVGAEWSVALLLLVCSVTLNGIGAIWADSWRWNQVPTDINQDLGRLWDWRHPPFLGMPNDSGSHLHKPGP
jgi:hypothetical protein